MSKWRKIAYGVGSFGTALSYQSFNKGFQFFYLDEIKITPTVFATVMVVYALWNAVNDPLMGHLSDSTRSRFGRRIPYILFGAIPFGIFYWLMWIPPRNAELWLLVAYMVATLFIFDTLFSLVVIAWTALMPEQWPDLKERAEVSGWREIFSVIGALLGVGLMPMVIDRIGYLYLGLLYGGLTAVSFLVSLLGSRETAQAHTDEPSPGLWASLRAAFRIRSFRWFLIANWAKEMIFLIMPVTMSFYAAYVLRLEDTPGGLGAATKETILMGGLFILSIPGMFVWTKITQRVGARQAWIYASFVLMPGLLVLMLAPSYSVALIAIVMMSLGFPGLLMLYNLVISDIIDEDEVNNGVRREGFFFGMNGVVIRLAYAVQAILSSAILDWTGYVPDQPIQPAAAVWGMRFLQAGVPLLCCLLMAYGLWCYPLHGITLTSMRDKMLARHTMKPSM